MDSVIEVIADSWNPWRRLSRMQEPVPIVPAVQPLRSVQSLAAVQSSKIKVQSKLEGGFQKVPVVPIIRSSPATKKSGNVREVS